MTKHISREAKGLNSLITVFDLFLWVGLAGQSWARCCRGRGGWMRAWEGFVYLLFRNISEIFIYWQRFWWRWTRKFCLMYLLLDKLFLPFPPLPPFGVVSTMAPLHIVFSQGWSSKQCDLLLFFVFVSFRQFLLCYEGVKRSETFRYVFKFTRTRVRGISVCLARNRSICQKER